MNYKTTTEEQNKLIDINKRYVPASLDENLKLDLRSSHFILGQEPVNYQSEYKKYFSERNMTFGSPSFKNNNSRHHNYSLGSEPVNYTTETHEKFISPKIDKSTFDVINSNNLLNANYNFGNDYNDWITSGQAAYFPKVKYS
jgi:hypothetical protein